MNSDGSDWSAARSQAKAAMFESAASSTVRTSAPVKASAASRRVGGRLVSRSLATGTPAWIE
jgi:hypothetical protein